MQSRIQWIQSPLRNTFTHNKEYMLRLFDFRPLSDSLISQ